MNSVWQQRPELRSTTVVATNRRPKISLITTDGPCPPRDTPNLHSATGTMIVLIQGGPAFCIACGDSHPARQHAEQ